MSDDYRQRQKELIEDLAAIVEELGWVIAIPQDEADETLVQGLLIGTEEFIVQLVAQANQEAEIVEFDSNPVTNTKKQIH